MLNFLKLLIFLQVLTCLHGVHYYDDEYVADGEPEKDADVDIEDDDVYLRMLISGGYRPLEHTITKYTVSIRTKAPTTFFGDNHFCSGVLVGFSLVVTAAHCVVNDNNFQLRPSRCKIVLGTPNRLLRTKYTIQMNVIDIYIHPEFHRRRNYDIAMLILDGMVPFKNPKIDIIGLVRERPQPGMKCTSVGWGQIIDMGPITADAIYVDLDILPLEMCLEDPFLMFDPKTELCVGDSANPSKSVCRGDTGSPLICENKLAGIVSRGLRCDAQVRKDIPVYLIICTSVFVFAMS